MEYHLAVDVGSRTVTAAVSDRGDTASLPLEVSGRLMPAVGLLRADGEVVVGERAISVAWGPTDELVHDVLAEGAASSIAVLVASAFVQTAVEAATALRGEGPATVTLTTPTPWKVAQHGVLREAARRAGLEQVRFRAAPLAAAGRAWSENSAVGPGIVVDVGERPTVQVVGIDSSALTLFGSTLSGPAEVALARAVLRSVDPLMPELAALPPDEQVRLQVSIAQAVTDLAAGKSPSSVVVVPGRAVRVHVTSEVFVAALADLVQVVVGLVEQALAESSGTRPALVHLVGGYLELPTVREALTTGLAALGLQVSVDKEAAQAVALGAAAEAARRTSEAAVVDGVGVVDEINGDGEFSSDYGVSATDGDGVDDDVSYDNDGSFDVVEEDLAGELGPLDEGDDVQYTVYRPVVVRPQQWYPLIAFVHRVQAYLDPTTERWTNPLVEVRRMAERRIADEPVDFTALVRDGRQWLPRGSDLVLVPWLEEGEVNPPKAWLRWEEPVHQVEFRIRTRAVAGRSVLGGIRVFVGVVLVGEVDFRVPVSNAAPSRVEQVETSTAKPYKDVFVSYAHADHEIVNGVLDYCRATGDQYLVDVTTLRAGELWEPRLQEKIFEADVFQLFWSHHAMRSAHVRREWEFALELGRASFVRPVYWQRPRPVDPALGLPTPALNALHWFPLPSLGGAFTDASRSTGFAIQAEASAPAPASIAAPRPVPSVASIPRPSAARPRRTESEEMGAQATGARRAPDDRSSGPAAVGPPRSGAAPYHPTRYGQAPYGPPRYGPAPYGPPGHGPVSYGPPGYGGSQSGPPHPEPARPGPSGFGSRPPRRTRAIVLIAVLVLAVTLVLIAVLLGH